MRTVQRHVLRHFDLLLTDWLQTSELGRVVLELRLTRLTDVRLNADAACGHPLFSVPFSHLASLRP